MTMLPHPGAVPTGPLPSLRVFLRRLWRQHAINRILIRSNPVPAEIPIIRKRPLDVFVNGLPPVVSVCCVVKMDIDGCGATDFTCWRMATRGFFLFFLFRVWTRIISEIKGFTGLVGGEVHERARVSVVTQ